MRLQLYTWDGHNINDYVYPSTGTYQAVIAPGNSEPPATANFIDMGQSDPILAGKTLGGGFFTFFVILNGVAIETGRDQLNGWFRPQDFTLRKLIALDLDNGSKDWYLEGYPVTAPTLQDGTANKYSITLALSTPYWIENDINTNTWSITSATETEVMANVGNVSALPRFSITPKEPKSSNGLLYQVYRPLYFANGNGGQVWVDIVNNAWDTATEVSASRMQADGDDIGVNIDGVYVDRWLDDMNSDNTSVWVLMTFQPVPAMTLKVALPDSYAVPATLQVTYTGTITPVFSANSSLIVEDEIITYSTYTVNTSTKTVTFIPTAREAKNTSYAPHSIGTAVYWLQHEVWITYGNASATAPTVDATKAPPFDIATSSNSLLTFTSFGGTGSYTRPLQPAPTAIKSPANYGACYYGGDHATKKVVQRSEGNSEQNISFDEIGMYLCSWINGNTIVGDPTENISWTFTHPGRFSNVEATGEKYRNRVFGTAVIRASQASAAYQTIASPTDPDAWEAVESIDIALTDYPTQVVFSFYGSLGSGSIDPGFYSPSAHPHYSCLEFTEIIFEIYQPITVKAVGSGSANYKLSGSLKNNTTGNSIVFNDVITKLDLPLVIDCATKEIYSADGKRLRGMISFDGAKRDDWLSFVSGNNSIIFADTGTVEVEIVTTWYARNTI